MECDGVFAVYIESKAIFIHPFSDFSVSTRIVRLGITSGVRLPLQREGTDAKPDRSKQPIAKWSGVGGGTVTLGLCMKVIYFFLNVCPVDYTTVTGSEKVGPFQNS